MYKRCFVLNQMTSHYNKIPVRLGGNYLRTMEFIAKVCLTGLVNECYVTGHSVNGNVIYICRCLQRKYLCEQNRRKKKTVVKSIHPGLLKA